MSFVVSKPCPIVNSGSFYCSVLAKRRKLSQCHFLSVEAVRVRVGVICATLALNPSYYHTYIMFGFRLRSGVLLGLEGKWNLVIV